jgi:hypothetical protein
MSVFYLPVASAYGQNLQVSDGAKLYFFEPGTTTPKTTYSDPGETVAQAHPVVANSAGRFDAIFLSGTYKVRLDDKNDVTYWTEDNITGSGETWNDQGDFDSSTNSGDYPASGNDNDVYRVTEEFVLNSASGSHRVFVGDFIKANKAGATGVDADWDIVKGVSVNVNTVALTDQATIATNCKIGTVFTVTLAGNRTLANPTNKRIGQTYTWIVTQDATGSRTLAFGTDFSFAGDSTIKPTASAVTMIVGKCVSSTSVVCEMLYYQDYSVDFETKNLLIDVASNTTVTMTADRMSFLNSTSWPKYSDNVSETYDITTDLMSGTSEKASHWYQLWYDSAGVRMMVPDLTGTTDGTTASKLVDSGADFVTDKVSIGDVIYNTTDLTQTTVTAIDDLNTLSVADDIFVSGEGYKIRMLSPTGLGSYKSRVGAAYNNGSSNLDDSTYTQIQEEKNYSVAAGDFTITNAAADWTTSYSIITTKQSNDWTGTGTWKVSFNIDGSVGSTATTNNITISGLQYSSDHSVNVTTSNLISMTRAEIVASTSLVRLAVASNTANWAFSGTVTLAKKPTFHT